MVQMQTETAAPAAFIPAEAGELAIHICETPIHQLAFRAAAEIVAGGGRLVVLDGADCFHPLRMTQSASMGAMNPAEVLHSLQILRAPTCRALENAILFELEPALKQFKTRCVFIADPLNHFYGGEVSTRDAAHSLGRMKSKLERLAAGGVNVTVFSHRKAEDLGTRSHFLLSLCAAADRVYFRNKT